MAKNPVATAVKAPKPKVYAYNPKTLEESRAAIRAKIAKADQDFFVKLGKIMGRSEK
ncbi:hypothetical protein [Brevibacillus marinus]|uniref:hypothetical protein n=1 Tax=Brevibacillus marinus TaxID=2496837 RepID=UPI0013DF2C49|nr:hypothetical protein [Brevibacillus marinus]